MSFWDSVKRAFSSKQLFFSYMASFGLLNWMPDSMFIKMMYKVNMGKKLNLENPTTYSEKLQWIKLYDRNPKYPLMVDKYSAKEYVAGIIGKEHIIPTLGVWDTFDEIDFDSLPRQFVLKCTHNSGGIVICTDKKSFNKATAKKKLEKGLRKNYFWQNREWPYKAVKPRIIAEEYMVDESGVELKDYKFFCFDGIPKYLFVACDRANEDEETKFNFYDMDFNLLPFTNGHPNAPDGKIKKPIAFEEMKRLASDLSKGIKHIRVDFYDIQGKVYFGELTFFHWSGFVPFEPPEWDERFGAMIDLTSLKRSVK